MKLNEWLLRMSMKDFNLVFDTSDQFDTPLMMQWTCRTCSLYSVCCVFTLNGLLVSQIFLERSQIQNLARLSTKIDNLFGLSKFYDLTKLQDVFVSQIGRIFIS